MADVASLILKADSTQIRKADKDLDGLTKGAGKAERASDQLRDGFKKVAAGLAVVAAAAAAVTVAMVKMSLTSIDSLAKTADKLGVTTEALAGLRLQAELTGVSTTTMDMALQRMVRRVSEAAQGTGEAVNALKELNLNARDLAALPLDEQFKRIADAMKGTASQGDRVRLAMKLFDSEGVALVNTLAAGGDALDETTKRAIAYGTALSRVDAAKVEAANDAITEAKTAFAGVANTLTVQLAPIIKAVADEFSDASLEADGFKDSVVSGVETSVKAVGLLADTVFTVGLGFKSLSVVALSVFAAMEGGIARVASTFRGFTKDYIDFYNKYLNIGEDLVFEELSRNASISASALREAKIQLKEMTEQGPPSARITEFFDDLRAKAAAAGKAIADAAAASGGGGGTAAPWESTFEAPAPYERVGLPGADVDILELEKASADLLIDFKTEQYALKESAEYEHRGRLFNIQQMAADREAQIERERDALILQARENFMNNMAGLMNTGSRKVFAIGKVAAIAQAAIKGKLAVIEAWEAGMSTGGPWAPIVAGAYAAAAAANAGSMIANISGATFGGGGGPATAPTQGASGYGGGGFDMGGLSGAGGGDNALLIELTQAIKALKGIPVGQIITQGLSAAGGIVTASADGHINELAHEISGSNYV